MKVYVVENSGAIGGDCYVGVEVYSTREKAEKAVNNLVKINRTDSKARGYDRETRGKGFYEAWIDSEYSYNHDLIRILEKEIQ